MLQPVQGGREKRVANARVRDEGERDKGGEFAVKDSEGARSICAAPSPSGTRHPLCRSNTSCSRSMFCSSHAPFSCTSCATSYTLPISSHGPLQRRDASVLNEEDERDRAPFEQEELLRYGARVPRRDVFFTVSLDSKEKEL